MSPLISASQRPSAVIVEDEALVAEDVSTMLAELGYDVLGTAGRAEEALELIRRTRPDIVLMDVHLKDGGSGIEVSRAVKREFDIPVVFSTAYADAGTIERAASTGPFGYVVKPFHQRELGAAVAMALYRHRADRQLHEMERWLSMTLGSIADAVIAADIRGLVTYINPAAEALTGWSRADAIGAKISEVFVVRSAGSALPVADPVERVLSSGVTFHLTQETELRARSGRYLPIDDSIAPLRGDTGNIEGVVVIFRDRSAAKRAAEERREIELRMLEAQRLESLGVLAGGIAHDFNNLLTIILGNITLADSMIAAESELRPLLQQVKLAGNRAATLSQQMLAYAGRAPRHLRSMDLSAFVGESVSLLHTAVHPRVVLSMDLAPKLPRIDADEAQLQQVVMNLVLNASDAIGERGGSVAVRTFALPQDAQGRRRLGLEVRDDGPGMSESVRQRIFEPFFTTKMLGRGLGLSAVQGIVREHGGSIRVESAEGEGSCFIVDFPEGVMPGPATDASSVHHGRLSGRMLVVDDERGVRSAAVRILQRLGMTAFEADGADQALEVMQRHGPLQVALIDVTMPGVSGFEVAQRLRELQPSLPIVMMSGYSESDVFANVADRASFGFLQKPFSVDATEHSIRHVLGT